MAQAQDLCTTESRGACLAEVPLLVGVLVGWWQAWGMQRMCHPGKSQNPSARWHSECHDDPGVALAGGTACAAPSHEQPTSSGSAGEMSHPERRNEGEERKEK